jgi:hypothetical protein
LGGPDQKPELHGGRDPAFFQGLRAWLTGGHKQMVLACQSTSDSNRDLEPYRSVPFLIVHGAAPPTSSA